MEKAFYETPVSAVFELKTEGAVLNTSVGSVQTMTGKSGTWDDDDEYDY